LTDDPDLLGISIPKQNAKSNLTNHTTGFRHSLSLSSSAEKKRTLLTS